MGDGRRLTAGRSELGGGRCAFGRDCRMAAERSRAEAEHGATVGHRHPLGAGTRGVAGAPATRGERKSFPAGARSTRARFILLLFPPAHPPNVSAQQQIPCLQCMYSTNITFTLGRASKHMNFTSPSHSFPLPTDRHIPVLAIRQRNHLPPPHLPPPP